MEIAIGRNSGMAFSSLALAGSNLTSIPLACASWFGDIRGNQGYSGEAIEIGVTAHFGNLGAESFRDHWNSNLNQSMSLLYTEYGALQVAGGDGDCVVKGIIRKQVRDQLWPWALLGCRVDCSKPVVVPRSERVKSDHDGLSRCAGKRLRNQLK